MSDVAERVRAIVAENLGLEAHVVTDEARLAEDLKADSLDTVAILTAVEEAFDLPLQDGVLQRELRVTDLISIASRETSPG